MSTSQKPQPEQQPSPVDPNVHIGGQQVSTSTDEVEVTGDRDSGLTFNFR